MSRQSIVHYGFFLVVNNFRKSDRPLYDIALFVFILLFPSFIAARLNTRRSRFQLLPLPHVDLASQAIAIDFSALCYARRMLDFEWK